MREIAALTASFGGDIRLTRRQNFIITGIPTAQLDDVIAQVGAIGFPLEANGLYASSIGCIGDPHCNYAVTPTKTKLATIIERLVNQFGEQVGGLKLNLDGCPHACAQHWTGDIGLQGTTSRGPAGEPIEAFDIILRGGLGKDAAIGKPIVGACRRRWSRITCRACSGLTSNAATTTRLLRIFACARLTRS